MEVQVQVSAVAALRARRATLLSCLSVSVSAAGLNEWVTNKYSLTARAWGLHGNWQQRKVRLDLMWQLVSNPPSRRNLFYSHQEFCVWKHTDTRRQWKGSQSLGFPSDAKEAPGKRRKKKRKNRRLTMTSWPIWGKFCPVLSQRFWTSFLALSYRNLVLDLWSLCWQKCWNMFRNWL